MAGYRIPRQPDGTRVSYWPDPRGPNHGQHYWGTIIQHTGDTVLVVWDDDDEFYETWDGRELRYRIDRGQIRLKQPPKPRRARLPPDQLVCKMCGKPRQLKCNCPRPGATKPEEWGSTKVRERLTLSSSDDSMESSNEGHRAPVEPKGANMATKPKAAKAVEVEDTEEVTEGAALSAKEAAAALGTDARTLRKFLRKRSGLVGQGNRWEIDPGEMKTLKKEFDAYVSGQKAEKAEKAAKAKEAPAIDDLDDAFEEIDDSDLEELDV